MLHTFAGICQGNDVNNKAFDYCKTVKVVIEKKIENRHSHCLRNSPVQYYQVHKSGDGQWVTAFGSHFGQHYLT